MIWWNGRLVAEDEFRCDPSDRGLLLGDGVFETMATIDGSPLDGAAHWARLEGGAAALGFEVPLRFEAAADAMRGLLAENGLGAREGALRVTVTRGPGPRGLRPPPSPSPSVLMQAWPAGPRPAAFSAVTVRVVRNEHSLTSRWKTLSNLDQVLAAEEANRLGADEAILLNTAGRVACGSRSNLFVGVEGVLVTPPVSDGALPGITRGALLREADAFGLRVEEQPVRPDVLMNAGEVLLTNALIGVVAVTRLDDRVLPPGPMAGRVRTWWAARR